MSGLPARLELGRAQVLVERARREDVAAIRALLLDDELGRHRESADLAPYVRAFDRLDVDPDELLVVARLEDRVVATAQATLLVGLSRGATLRWQIEGVRVASDLRGGGLGRALLELLLDLGRERGAGLAQLTSDASRSGAHRFYADLGFRATHVGLKRRL